MGMVTGLRQVAQHVEDLDASVAFYRDLLGCQLVARFDPPGLAFLRLGPVRLLLEAAAPPALLYLEVDDVAARCDELRQAGVTFGPAGEEEWMAFPRDPAGNLVALSGRRRPV